MCIISYCAVTAGSRYQWHLLFHTPKHKSITVIDIYNTILQVSMQIDTLPEVMLTTPVIAWGNILLLRKLYCILMRRWWGGFLIERRVGLWTVLLVGHLTVRPSRLLMVLGLHKTVSTDWRASRWPNTDYSQSYSRSGTNGMLFSHGSCHWNLGDCESQRNRGSCGSHVSRGHKESRRSHVSVGSCQSQRNRESQSTCGSRGRGRSRCSQGRRRSYRSRRCSGSQRYCERRESCQGRCGRHKKIELCQGLRSGCSPGDPALELAVFECMLFERVETKLSNCLPPESRGKHTQQHLCPLILNHHDALGNYSPDIVICAKERFQGCRNCLHLRSGCRNPRRNDVCR